MSAPGSSTARLTRALLSLLLALGCSFGAEASAALEAPESAARSVEDALREEAMTFCKAPRTPLSARSKALCPAAQDLPDCAGFVAACEAQKRPTEPEKPRSRLMDDLVSLLGTLAQVLVWLVIVAVLVLIAIPIVQAIRKRRRDATLSDTRIATGSNASSSLEPAPLERIDDAELALRRADDLAGRGELDRAAAMYLAASLSALDRRGAIRIARSRTNGEYVRSCAELEAKPRLRGIVSEVDRIQFGGAPASAERVGKVAELARGLVRVLPATFLTLFLLAFSVLGCGRPPGLDHSADPSGDDLFVSVLRRQGVKVGGLQSSLATLPLVKPGEVAPIVVVDLERTHLEEDAEEHLVKWVDGGGVLVLVGNPSSWPRAFGAQGEASESRDVVALLAPRQRVKLERDSEDSDEDEDSAARERRLDEEARSALRRFPGKIARGQSLTMEGAEPVAILGDGKAFALSKQLGHGLVLGMANDDLFTNAVLARKENAPVVAALFASLMALPARVGVGPEPGGEAQDLSGAGRADREVRLARPEDGVSPPSNPFSALARAGLEKGMWHALAASLVLFAAYGVRHARPRPTAPPLRRAFTEHVEATGAFYARTRAAPHALHGFVRYAEDVLRPRMPRGTTDVPAFLAQRSGRPAEECARLWQRALEVQDEDVPRGDELFTLRELRALVSAAVRRESPRPGKNPT